VLLVESVLVAAAVMRRVTVRLSVDRDRKFIMVVKNWRTLSVVVGSNPMMYVLAKIRLQKSVLKRNRAGGYHRAEPFLMLAGAGGKL